MADLTPHKTPDSPDTPESQDTIALYSKRILQWAARIPLCEPLADADGCAKRRAPLCGSYISVALNLDKDGRISAYSHNVKACALGQAAASIIAHKVIGLDRETLAKGRAQLAEMLENGGEPPESPFEELAILQSARDYKNRHASILLSFDATLAAIDSAT